MNKYGHRATEGREEGEEKVRNRTAIYRKTSCQKSFMAYSVSAAFSAFGTFLLCCLPLLPCQKGIKVLSQAFGFLDLFRIMAFIDCGSPPAGLLGHFSFNFDFRLILP